MSTTRGIAAAATRTSPIVSVLGAGLIVLSGCSGGGGGTAAAPPPPPPPPPTVAPGSIDTLLLSADQLGGIVGTKFNYAEKPAPGWMDPSDPDVIDAGNPECDAVNQPNKTSMGTGFTGWRENYYKEGKDDFNHIVDQAVALTADPSAAKQLLNSGFAKPLNDCDGSVIHIKDGKHNWRLSRNAVTATDVRWISDELANDAPDGWACFYNARAINNVVTYAMVCQSGDGAPAATNIVNTIAAKVPGATSQPVGS